MELGFVLHICQVLTSFFACLTLFHVDKRIKYVIWSGSLFLWLCVCGLLWQNPVYNPLGFREEKLQRQQLQQQKKNPLWTHCSGSAETVVSFWTFCSLALPSRCYVRQIIFSPSFFRFVLCFPPFVFLFRKFYTRVHAGNSIKTFREA